jgi:hypothetical protein
VDKIKIAVLNEFEIKEQEGWIINNDKNNYILHKYCGNHIGQYIMLMVTQRIYFQLILGSYRKVGMTSFTNDLNIELQKRK